MTATEFLEVAPGEFDVVVSRMTIEERRLLATDCESYSIGYAERAAYLNERNGYSRGDQGHSKAVKAFNRVRKAVRKAFGYTLTHPISF